RVLRNERRRRMKRSRFTEEQILAALKQHAAGASTKELCRQLGIATETLYNWKRKYGGMEVSEARRLRALEDENRQLKRIVAEQALDNRVLKDPAFKKLLTPAARRQPVCHCREGWWLSERHACRLVGIGRSSLRYTTKRSGDQELRERLRQLGGTVAPLITYPHRLREVFCAGRVGNKGRDRSAQTFELRLRNGLQPLVSFVVPRNRHDGADAVRIGEVRNRNAFLLIVRREPQDVVVWDRE